MPIIVQQDATIYSLFISVNRSTCLGWFLHPSSAAHVTVSTASGISKTVPATCRKRCPDDVSGDMQEDEIPGGDLSLNLLTTHTMVTTGIFPCKEKFPW